MISKLQENTKLYSWWKPKAGFLLALLFFVVALTKASFQIFLQIFLLSSITLSAIGVWGHLLNDWGDRVVDAKAGKKNFFHNKPYSFFLTTTFITLVIALTPWLFLPATNFSYGLLALEFFLFITYATPPLRLKEKIYFAIIADALYAYAIPAVLAFYTYTLAFHLNYPAISLILLFIWSFTIGLRHVLYHHVADASNDKKSNINNFAHKFSLARINTLIKQFLLPIEIIFGLLFLVCFQESSQDFFLISLIVVYFLFSGTIKSLLSFSWFPNHTLKGFILDNYYQFVWIILSLFFLVFRQPFFLILLIVIIPLFTNFNSGVIYDSIKHGCKYFYKNFVFSPSSAFINYSIYYFRKFILSWNEEKNRGSYFKEWQQEKIKNKNGRIAIFNQNLNKYTETFVQGHVNSLPFKIDFYYGDNLLNHHKEGHLISNHFFINNLKKVVFRFFNFNEEQLIINKLQENNIKVLLSEFGTTGVKVTKLAKATGIPHICIFYGYDAWNKNVLKENKEAYKTLFQSAQLIIGVSKDICSQLETIGCPKQKITYLPCYVNLDLYNSKKKIIKKFIFLSVGRFAETKSPHLTILAFKEVLKEIPDAKLRMIGKDGGGELFEACYILVKALKIENSVHFLGVQTPEQVALEMQNARVFVQHSLTTPLMGDKEGTPVAVMEAMASGLAVVATKHAGISEIIENGVSGVLVEEYDYLAMAKEMIRVCKSDEFVDQLGKNAQKSILDNKLILNNNTILSNIIQLCKRNENEY